MRETFQTEAFQPLIARSGLSRLAGMPAGVIAGLRVEHRTGLGIATVISRKDAEASLAARVQQLFGLPLPRGPRRAKAQEVSFIGIGPGAWLATREGDASDASGFAPLLARELSPLASVSDQTDAYPILRLSGPNVREMLGRLIAVDIRARAFTIDDVAVTAAAHISVTLWRIEDRPDRSPAFEVAFPRSSAESFWHALQEAGADGSGVPVATNPVETNELLKNRL